YVGRNDGAWEKVIKQVGHGRDLLDAASHICSTTGEEDEAGAVVGAVHDLRFHARANEVVADLAAGSPANIHNVAAAVQQPVRSALSAKVDALIGGHCVVEP